MRFQAPRGTEDVLPSSSHAWLRLEADFREHCRLYGYGEIRTPTFEDTDLFVRSSGETSEVVSKQMYRFTDKGGRDIALKPEGTAPAVRAAIEHGLCPPGTVLRMGYVTPIYRYERPQKGRLRESHQFGIELLGSAAPAADAEVIEFTARFYERLGLKGVRVLLNSLGRDECRRSYREALLKFAEPLVQDWDGEARDRLRANPLRILDSKDEALKAALAGAPSVQDFLEPESRERFEAIRRLLDAANVSYAVDSGIVRGLDYYTETVFEVQSGSLGSQNALCGGGRYDGLAQELGGPSTPAVGVAMGIERALMVLEAEGARAESISPDVFVVAVGEGALDAGLELARSLREAGFSCLIDLEGRSMKSQMNQANKSGARFAAILAEEETAGGTVSLRDMRAADQRSVPASEVAVRLRGSL